ncbi:hypothetical protein G6F55_014118 [Rhizopus delemar]|nr:hypothetical protein G6F55_014118 [Rhizopus delemar]
MRKFNAEQHPVFDAARAEQALRFQVIGDVARRQVLLPARAHDLAGCGVVTRQVGVGEVAIQLEDAQRVAQLPVGRQRIRQARAEGLRAVVDVVAVRVAVDGAAAHVCGPAVHAGNAAVGRSA